jgi:hypothetical protein
MGTGKWHCTTESDRGAIGLSTHIALQGYKTRLACRVAKVQHVTTPYKKQLTYPPR